MVPLAIHHLLLIPFLLWKPHNPVPLVTPYYARISNHVRLPGTGANYFGKLRIMAHSQDAGTKPERHHALELRNELRIQVPFAD